MDEKFLLKKNTVDKGILCSMSHIEGYDYYVESKKSLSVKGDYSIEFVLFSDEVYIKHHEVGGFWINKIVATNNNNLNLPKFSSEYEILAKIVGDALNINSEPISKSSSQIELSMEELLKIVAKVHQINSDDNMTTFLEWVDINGWIRNPFPSERFSDGLIRYSNVAVVEKESDYKELLPEELLKLWKLESPKTIYYG